MSTEKPAKAAVACGVAALFAAATLGAQEIPPLPPPGIDLPHVVLVSLGGEIGRKCENRLELAECATTDGSIGPETWTEDLPDLRLVARITTPGPSKSFACRRGTRREPPADGGRALTGTRRRSRG